MDRVDKRTRQRIMSSNRGKHTSPEIEVRKALFGHGFRFRLHVKGLPGKPDLVLPKYKNVIFVHGCFWHGHDCKRQPKSKSNRSYWVKKIDDNRKRDLATRNNLIGAGWRVLVIWECAIRRQLLPFRSSIYFKKVLKWLRRDGKLAILSEAGFVECL